MVARSGFPVFSCAALVVTAFAAAGVGGASASDWIFDPSFGAQRGRIGVQVQSMTSELREYFGAPGDRGVLVVHVAEGRPGARAGIEVGDVIVAAGATPVRGSGDLVRVVGRVEAGEALELRIVRKGVEREIAVEPEGEPVPWVDGRPWRERVEEHMRRGSQELRRRLEDLERRLRDLERRLEEREFQAT
jgi:predicted metalloprotease with PDZ domain